MSIATRSRSGLMFLYAILALGFFTTTNSQGQDDVLANSIGMKLKKIPSGKFMMGMKGKQKEVKIAQDFHLGVYEVTQEQYEKVMGTKPSIFKDKKQNPVENVSWDDAVEFCRKLSELPAEKKAGHVYRLPSAAEWEYACRAGTTTTYSFGDDAFRLGEFAWYPVNSNRSTHPVGQKKPNPWGIYDMYGNVYEWILDSQGSDRVARGGGWAWTNGRGRSLGEYWVEPSYRNYDLGFRVARGPVSKSSK